MKQNVLDTLTPGQHAAWNAVMAGHNVFITGPGGTGKSFLIDLIIYELGEQKKNVIICAPTGIAASKIGGATIHRVFGFDVDSVIKQNGKLKRRTPQHVLDADVIIIDEISMVRIEMFDCIINSLIAATEKTGKHKQIIVLGDFLQLPPFYSHKTEQEEVEKYYSRSIPVPWAFLGDRWKDCHFETILLTDIVRQTNTEFQHFLNLARKGDPSCIEFFNTHTDLEEKENEIYLFTRQEDVIRENNKRLRSLPGEPYYIPTFTYGNLNPEETDEIIKITILKDGARVMMTTNDSNNDNFARNVWDYLLQVDEKKKKKDQFVNGSFGTVYSARIDPKNPKDDAVFVILDGSEEWIEVKRRNFPVYAYHINKKGKFEKTVVGSISQIPVVPAYATTVHKSQGQTYDALNFDPHRCFAEGQLYVALSRARYARGIHLVRPITQADLKTSVDALHFYDKLKDNTSSHATTGKKRGRPKKIQKAEVKKLKGATRKGGRPPKFGKEAGKKSVSMKVPEEIADVLSKIFAEAFPKDDGIEPDMTRYKKLHKHLSKYYTDENIIDTIGDDV